MIWFIMLYMENKSQNQKINRLLSVNENLIKRTSKMNIVKRIKEYLKKKRDDSWLKGIDKRIQSGELKYCNPQNCKECEEYSYCLGFEELCNLSEEEYQEYLETEKR